MASRDAEVSPPAAVKQPVKPQPVAPRAAKPGKRAGPKPKQHEKKVAALPRGAISLTVTTVPSADIYLKGKRIGRAPLTVSVPRGTVTLTIRNPGVGLNAVRAVSPSGASHTASFVFKQGKIGFQLPAGQTVIVDGFNRGTTPVQPVTAYEGVHTVVLAVPGRGMSRRTVEVKPGETAWVR